MLQKLILSFVLFNCVITIGQVKINGQITDQNRNPIEGCHIHIGNKTVNSDANGAFVINNVSKGKTKVYIMETHKQKKVIDKCNLQLEEEKKKEGRKKNEERDDEDANR